MSNEVAPNTESLEDALKELSFLLNQPGIPQDCIDSAIRFLDCRGQCFVIKLKRFSASIATESGMIVQPSNRLVRFIAAFRAHDWHRVSIIEHEATHPS
jgi:hypothetical protein